MSWKSQSSWRPIHPVFRATVEKDRFGDSGAPWELIKEFEVSAEHIAQKALELIAIAKAKREAASLQLAN